MHRPCRVRLAAKKTREGKWGRFVPLSCSKCPSKSFCFCFSIYYYHFFFSTPFWVTLATLTCKFKCSSRWNKYSCETIHTVVITDNGCWSVLVLTKRKARDYPSFLSPVLARCFRSLALSCWCKSSSYKSCSSYPYLSCSFCPWLQYLVWFSTLTTVSC